MKLSIYRKSREVYNKMLAKDPARWLLNQTALQIIKLNSGFVLKQATLIETGYAKINFVYHLMKKGVIRRERYDGRSHIYFFTEKGKDIKNELYEIKRLLEGK